MLSFVVTVCLAEAIMTNPLLPKWTGPYGGVPPFAAVRVGQF